MRIDLVFDVYREDSLKRDVRMRRGNEVCRFAVRKETPVPKNFKSFLHNEGNKTGLFHLIASLIHEKNNCEITIVGTKDTEIIANKNVDHGELSPCNMEEEDTCMFLHVKHQAWEYKKIKVVTVDSDVVIIALFVLFSFKRQRQLQELWVEFGSGKDKIVDSHTHLCRNSRRKKVYGPTFLSCIH